MFTLSRSFFRSGLTDGAKLATSASRAKHSLPNLPYDYKALEPIISGEIMQLHHQKHHAAYVNNFNVAFEKLQEGIKNNCIKTIISQQPALRFNGGGHLNHSIFWQNLTPKGGGQPSGELANQIKRDFESFDNFKKMLSEASVGVQGSGWGWLGYCSNSKRLKVTTCANQDPLQPTTGLVPLLGIDVWEHAYYLQYKSVRADYVKAIWDVVNWKDVEQRFGKAAGGK